MRGNNFLRTILRLAQERDELRIVADQYGAPTWCRTIADTTAHIVALANSAQDVRECWEERSGLYHLTAQGQTTWYGFTQAILENSTIAKKPALITIKAEDYPLPARRPGYSVMSCELLLGAFCGLPDWDSALKLCLK